METSLSLKSQIRREVRMKGKQLSAALRDRQSQEIMRLLEDLPVFQRAHVVLLYAALPDEVQTLDFLQRWCRRKQLLLPVVVGNELELRVFTGTEAMTVGSFGILEPMGLQPFTDFSAIDLAIIPGVAFTLDGKRLGRGKGFYDRLLAHPAFRNVYKIGVALPHQILPNLPTEQHDVFLDAVVTAASDKSTF